jgi:hypothetical protein
MISEYFSQGSPFLNLEACFTCTGARAMHLLTFSFNDKKFVSLNQHEQARASVAQGVEE